ncbi:formyltransferase family protein [Thermosynechococcus sp. JY1334]|uniref:formyltransferase family protein n=1 Tax=unclassified Thermosynechococcus TaxID=2622553 RepID=UPI002859FBDC|nr:MULTISPECIES: formyltransferase family protein [unclassified Thermosynechococcus]MDR7904234.1 formyltransferase family protein [Thermosynechococcus sp. JY1334]WNC55431.1 formyltransferase family protein [Thermosynechococcus sp. JY1331]
MKISILSQKESWINDYLSRWVLDLSGEHEISWVHQQDALKGGDILFILSFWGIVARRYIEQFSSAVVVHESDLPKGRGWSPVAWQILEGKNIIPITLFRAAEKVDSGEIYLRDQIELEGHELIDEIREKQARKTIELCKKFIESYPDILEKGIPQKGEVTYYRKRTPEDSRLDISKTLHEQFNLFRIVDNEKYPAFFNYRGQRYILKISKFSPMKND